MNDIGIILESLGYSKMHIENYKYPDGLYYLGVEKRQSIQDVEDKLREMCRLLKGKK